MPKIKNWNIHRSNSKYHRWTKFTSTYIFGSGKCDYDVSSETWGIPDLPEVIVKMSVAKNGEKPKTGISKTQVLIVIDLQNIHMKMWVRNSNTVLKNSLSFHKGLKIQDSCQLWSLIAATQNVCVTFSMCQAINAFPYITVWSQSFSFPQAGGGMACIWSLRLINVFHKLSFCICSCAFSRTKFELYVWQCTIWTLWFYHKKKLPAFWNEARGRIYLQRYDACRNSIRIQMKNIMYTYIIWW